MIKYLCDSCGVEIPMSANRTIWSLDFDAPTGKKVCIQVDARVTIMGTTNSGHVCQECVVRTLVDGTPTKKGY